MLRTLMIAASALCLLMSRSACADDDDASAASDGGGVVTGGNYSGAYGSQPTQRVTHVDTTAEEEYKARVVRSTGDPGERLRTKYAAMVQGVIPSAARGISNIRPNILRRIVPADRLPHGTCLAGQLRAVLRALQSRPPWRYSISSPSL
eukprot:4953594-Pyramimonas_sp.AAC.1